MDVEFFDIPGEERIARMSESDNEENSDDSKVEVSLDGTSS
jgi:hypothetical protein